MSIAQASELRLALTRNGFTSIPLYGKEPPTFRTSGGRKGFTGWQQVRDVTPEMIRMWAKVWPEATNTGVLTCNAPALDLDIFNPGAAAAVEDLVRSRFGDDGVVMVRIGKPPKRAILFQTTTPFAKLTVPLHRVHHDPSLGAEKLELLCDRQQLVVDGIHPQTQRPYSWHGGTPWGVHRRDLPVLTQADARALVDDIADLLRLEYGYGLTVPRPSGRGLSSSSAGGGDNPGLTAALGNILTGADYHDSLRNLALGLLTGLVPGNAVMVLRALMDASQAPHDERWRERRADIPRAVDSAAKLIEARRQAASD
jgi:hypothetical protein